MIKMRNKIKASSHYQNNQYLVLILKINNDVVYPLKYNHKSDYLNQYSHQGFFFIFLVTCLSSSE